MTKLCNASTYLKPFTETDEECKDCFNLTGDVLLVEKVTGQEYKKDVVGPNGKMTQIYLAGGEQKKVDGLDMNLPMLVRVLSVGPGFYDDRNSDLKPVGCEVKPGDIILIGRMSVNWFSVFGSLISTTSSEIGVTRESEALGRWHGQEGYDRYFTALNKKLGPTTV